MLALIVAILVVINMISPRREHTLLNFGKQRIGCPRWNNKVSYKKEKCCFKSEEGWKRQWILVNGAGTNPWLEALQESYGQCEAFHGMCHLTLYSRQQVSSALLKAGNSASSRRKGLIQARAVA